MKNKVLIITSGFAPIPAVNGGAVEKLTTKLIDLNEKQNLYDFVVYSVEDEKAKRIKYNSAKINYVPISTVERQIERIINKILRTIKTKRTFSIFNKKLLKKLNSDYEKYGYILFENSMDIYVSVINKYPNSKYLFHLHNDLNDVSKTPQMAQVIAETAHKIIFVSDFLKNRFINLTNCQREKCYVLYNCTDLQNNKYININLKNQLIKQYSIDTNKTKFLYVGRLNEEKGILQLAQAFASLKDNNTSLIICGGTWGNEFRRNKFFDRIVNAVDSVKQNVIFTGYLDPEKVQVLYDISDVIVIPSICNEAFGMVMLEAILQKKPIIATRSGGMVEISPAYYDTLINNDTNVVKNLCDTMKKFVVNGDSWNRIIDEAFKQVTDDVTFDSNDYLNKFRLIIED